MELNLPLLPLRDIVVFPGMIVPLFVGRDKSVVALEKAMAADKEIFLVAQLDPAEDDPDKDDLYDIGVTATIMQLLKLPDGTVRVLVEGKQRAELRDLVERGSDYVEAGVRLIEEQSAEGPEATALMRSVSEQFENYSKLNKKMPAETAVQLSEIETPAALADAVAANIQLKVSDKQSLLVESNPLRRLEMAFAFMEGELGVLQVEKKIRGRVKRQMEKTQREYYLNEQMKAIQRELGNDDGEGCRTSDQNRHDEAVEGGQGQGQCRAEKAARDGADVSRSDRRS
jgi:ATP-dependent Lon protease